MALGLLSERQIEGADSGPSRPPRSSWTRWVEDEPTSEWETMLASALTLTDGEDAWLLMTSRPTGGGEFACYHLEVEYGEFSDEHPSFVELVRSGARQIAEGREG